MYFNFFFFLFFFMFLISFFISLFLMTYGCLVMEFYFSFIYNISFIFMADYISTMFFSFVSMISSMIFLYSKYYMNVTMKENFDNKRFMFTLFFFVLSMFFLIFSYSWFLIMLGWDGLGIVSFLLVIFYNNSNSLDSGILTVLSNRLGDCFFLMSFFSMMFMGDFSYFYLINYNSVNFIFMLLIILGCFTKSAQMPFSAWLPTAMAAPTPVSSLVHSSTLVTAGVYLIIRFNFLLTEFSNLIMILSLMTMFLGGLFACFELDFKKIVAMSTLSQLGFMIFSIFSVNWMLGFFHLIFHAFFKSMLFLSTGNLMHFLLGNQDSRYFSNFYFSFFAKTFFSASCLSLMGFPFILGFYSKDVIISFMTFSNFNILTVLFLLSCVFTVSYSMRLLKMGFLSFSLFVNITLVKEDNFFFTPIFLIFSFVVLWGNFFSFFFIPMLSFSFFELFTGILIICTGFFMFLKIEVLKKNILLFINMNMFSLNFFINKLSYNFMKTFNFYLYEQMWMEKISVEFFYNTFFTLKNFSKNLFSLNLIFFMILVSLMATMLL